MSLAVAIAEDHYNTAVETLPTLVPISWTGGAATSFQTSLDAAVLVVSGVATLLETANSAVDSLDLVSTQCGVVP